MLPVTAPIKIVQMNQGKVQLLRQLLGKCCFSSAALPINRILCMLVHPFLLVLQTHFSLASTVNQVISAFKNYVAINKESLSVFYRM